MKYKLSNYHNFIFAFVCMALTMCAMPVHAQEIRVVDDTGYELVLSKPAQRVIGLDGALSELMLALGLGHTLVGRTAADADIAGLQDLQVVGTKMRPNPELIVGLKPQVVLQILGSTQSTALGLGMRKLGVPVLLFHLESFEQINSVLLRLAKLGGVEAKAQALVQSYISRIGFLRTLLMDEVRVPLFYELRYPSLLGAAGTSIISEIITVAGGRNVLNSNDTEVRLSVEELVRKNPAVYIVQTGPLNPDPKPLSQRPLYDQIQAVQQQRVLTVRDIDFSRPGPRSIDAAEQLARWLHPHVDFDVLIPQSDARMK